MGRLLSPGVLTLGLLAWIPAFVQGTPPSSSAASHM